MEKAVEKTGSIVSEFTVAPRYKSEKEPACHEWFIEFDKPVANKDYFAKVLNQELMSQNKYYKDLIDGKIISYPIITPVLKSGFKKYMQHVGRLGGQNKIPKIANDRKTASLLKKLKLTNAT
tara:strand:- start:342 stop:707 length:366 start_codon:yes stop_codon:yes gene_type:complete